jgi:hypothetical protein
MSVAAEQIDGGKATLAELRRVGIEALVRALGPVGMARFLQQFDRGQGDYTAERDRILGSPTVDQVMDEFFSRSSTASRKSAAWGTRVRVGSAFNSLSVSGVRPLH